jgi:hypothetical protein
MGTRYNAGVWLECRKNAVGFLEEAKERLDGRAKEDFQSAITYYKTVPENLAKVASIFSWSPGVSADQTLPVDEKSRQALDAIGKARNAESYGLEALQGIVHRL